VDCANGQSPRSTTLLERTNVQQSDALGEDGWGTALWTEGQMKAPKDFMLPVPPMGLHVINSSIDDWQALINISHGFGHKTKWVFASTRREQRDGVGYDRPTDIAIHPSSLADHLRNMKGLKDSAHPNVLAGLPDFSLHTVRSAALHTFWKTIRGYRQLRHLHSWVTLLRVMIRTRRPDPRRPKSSIA